MFDSIKNLRGSGLKTRLFNPIDELYDLRLGVRTFGFLPAVGTSGSKDWQVHYVPTPYRKVIRTLRHVKLGHDDVFVDLGSGLGRTVFTASWLGAQRSVGVEINAALTASAQENYQRSRLRDRDIEFVCMGAQEYDFHEASVIYMFHPFGAGTLETVIQRMEFELGKHQRQLRIVYENPVYGAVLDQSRYFERFEEWPADKRNGSNHPVAFWRSV
jgi:Histone methylation protein DOT1